MAEQTQLTALLSGQAELAEPLGPPLALAGFTVTADAGTGADLLLIDACTTTLEAGRDLLRRWRSRAPDAPAVALTGAGARPAGWLDAGVDLCLPLPVQPKLYAAQAKAIARQIRSRQRLAVRADQARGLNRHLQDLYHQNDRDLELAYRLARQYQPEHLPRVGSVRVGVCHRPRSRIGGDFYDVVQLDEGRLGLYLADAMGRGAMTGGLLSVLMRKQVVMKEVVGRSYRLISPEDVLRRLDRELSALGMDDPPLVSMIVAQINCEDGHLSVARAAGSAPLHVPAEGEPEFWDSPPNSFLGSQAETYLATKGQLMPGDRLLFYSDGVRQVDDPDAAECLAESAAAHRDLPVQSAVEHIARDLTDRRAPTDDVTLIAVHFGEPTKH